MLGNFILPLITRFKYKFIVSPSRLETYLGPCQTSLKKIPSSWILGRVVSTLLTKFLLVLWFSCNRTQTLCQKCPNTEFFLIRIFLYFSVLDRYFSHSPNNFIPQKFMINWQNFITKKRRTKLYWNWLMFPI